MTEQEEFEFRHRFEAEQAAGAPAPEKGLMEQLVKPAVLPTGGAIAGTAFGAGVGTPFGMSVPGGIVGGAVGSALGEAANQMLGITEPSAANIGIAGGLSAAAGTVGAVARPIMKFALPGRAAQTLNAIAPEEVALRLKTIEPSITSAALFKQATAEKATVPLRHTAHTIDLMLDELTNVSKGVQNTNRQTISYLKNLKTMIDENPTGFTPIALQRELEGAGKVIKSVDSTGGSGSGAIKNVFKSMMSDLDEAASFLNQPGAKSLQLARETFKKEAVLRDIGESVETATKVLRGQGDNVQFNAASVIRDLGKNKFYKEAFSTGEREEIESVLTLLNKIPALKPGAGQTFGSGQFSNMARNAAVGTGVGMAVGGPTGAAVGGSIGAAAGPVTDFAKNLTTALQMKTGRAVLKELLTQSKGIATPQVASVLGAYAEAVRAGQVSE